ncbi:MAG TPA: biotin carboxylase N-terminal domain-containing protein [bacterium]|nr:biotin carboxylase N-terminal domain-containing protein [bacterium]
MYSVLIANRGEIAVRLVRACRELGFRAVAVYSPVDRRARHVLLSDEAYALPGDEPAASYLNSAALLEIARRAHIDALHPGYGFLSENPVFAAECQQAGVTFVGPPSAVLAECGDKARTRERLTQARVPVLPGTSAVSDEEARSAAERVGFPLLIKASGGGGGKGIHLVGSIGELPSTLRLARGEAKTAFGDDRVYLERWLPDARHIEVQILADTHGRISALGERDCSVQRRHQKLIEETPAPGLTPSMRRRLLEAAETGARMLGYVNAGTFEFLVHGDDYYFLEVNARLQVEHPVTESVTGADIVVQQFRIARGKALDIELPISSRGHSIECRISAEDPHEGFLPSTGTVGGLAEPNGPGIRVDSSLYPGMEVTRHYDPLLAKIIAWGTTRGDALARMRCALLETAVGGLATTVPFHLWALDDPAFAAGSHDTQFARRWDERKPGDDLPRALLAAAAFEHIERGRVRFPPERRDGAWHRASKEEGLERL